MSSVQILGSRWFLVLVVAVGVLLRLVQYLANRSLWIDETWLALNLLSRSFDQLTKQLDFAQGAPPGFLFAEEAFAKLIGFSEYSLRFFPLLSGCAALLAFAVLARRTLARPAAPFAVLLFAVADGLIYYSSEVKPYSTDVAASVALLLAGSFLLRSETAGVVGVLLAVAGLVVVAFSFPAVFFVLSIALVLGLRQLRRRRALLVTVSVASVWLLGSAAIAFFASSRLDEIRSGHRGFLGLSSSSSPVEAANFFGTNIAAALGFLQDAPFNQLQKLAVVLLIVGIWSLARRNPPFLGMLLIPFALAFAASALDLYPLSERTELFLLPAVVLLLVEGVAKLVVSVPGKWRLATAVVLVLGLAAGPVYLASDRLVHPRHREEVRSALEFVRDHWHEGDTLYLDYYAQYPLLYYERCKCLRLRRHGHELWPVRARGGPDDVSRAIVSTSSALVVGPLYRDHPEPYLNDLRRLNGRGRVWFLYSHVPNTEAESFIERDVIGELDRMGTRLEGIDRKGAHAYLYDL
jgi:4-amino-4-deoxy-L-arabinose transferase-like glycosyltransferase